MGAAGHYLVAYDISDNRERLRVERCVSRYGRRIQKSVFYCVLDAPHLSRLQGDLEVITCRTGFTLVVALARPARVLSFGTESNPLAENWAFIVSGDK